MGFLYFIISFLATTIGAISGLAGGIIIKPTLDALGNYPLSTIGMLSSSTVLCMTAVSLVRYLSGKIKIDYKRALLLSIGASIGGILGKCLFDFFAFSIEERTVKAIQGILLILLLVFVLFRKHVKRYQVTSGVMITLCGLLMGSISSFLGIGGGPINVAVICIAFSAKVKDAAVYSLATIFFSQLTTVLANAVTPGLGHFDLTMLRVMIPGAIIGGLIGTAMNRRLSAKKIEILFNAIMLLLIALNLFNIVRFLFIR